MAKTRNKTYRSINKPLTRLGVDRLFLVLILGSGWSVYAILDSFWFGLLAAAAAYAMVWKLTSKEPKLVPIWMLHIRQRQHYDPIRYALWRAEIISDATKE